VVQSLLRDQLAVARRIAEVIPSVAFGISVAGPQVRPIITAAAAAAPLRIELHSETRPELLQAADLVLVASGTAALEVAFYGRPMIVMYKASRLFYHAVARWMLSTRHLSLPNIVAGGEVVPEFMPYYRDPAVIARRAIALLSSPQELRSMSHRLEQVVAPLRGGSASQRAAELLIGMIDAAKD
jgi:lipid-A-disaccharide synthase